MLGPWCRALTLWLPRVHGGEGEGVLAEARWHDACSTALLRWGDSFSTVVYRVQGWLSRSVDVSYRAMVMVIGQLSNCDC